MWSRQTHRAQVTRLFTPHPHRCSKPSGQKTGYSSFTLERQSPASLTSLVSPVLLCEPKLSAPTALFLLGRRSTRVILLPREPDLHLSGPGQHWGGPWGSNLTNVLYTKRDKAFSPVGGFPEWAKGKKILPQWRGRIGSYSTYSQALPE